MFILISPKFSLKSFIYQPEFSSTSKNQYIFYLLVLHIVQQLKLPSIVVKLGLQHYLETLNKIKKSILCNKARNYEDIFYSLVFHIAWACHFWETCNTNIHMLFINLGLNNLCGCLYVYMCWSDIGAINYNCAPKFLGIVCF